MVRRLTLWALLAMAAAGVGTWFSWTLATPADLYKVQRSMAILMAGVLVSGTLLICATRRFWFARRGGHRHHRHRSGTKA